MSSLLWYCIISAVVQVWSSVQHWPVLEWAWPGDVSDPGSGLPSKPVSPAGAGLWSVGSGRWFLNIFLLFLNISSALDLKKELCSNDTNIISLSSLVSRVSSSEEYYERHVLGNMDNDWSNFGSVRLQSVLCLALAWCLVAVCLIKGQYQAEGRRLSARLFKKI